MEGMSEVRLVKEACKDPEAGVALMRPRNAKETYMHAWIRVIRESGNRG